MKVPRGAISSQRSQSRLLSHKQVKSHLEPSQAEAHSREIERLRAQHDVLRRRMHALEQQNGVYRLQVGDLCQLWVAADK